MEWAWVKTSMNGCSMSGIKKPVSPARDDRFFLKLFIKDQGLFRPYSYSTRVILIVLVGKCNSTGVLPVLITTSPALIKPLSFKISS